MTLAIPYVLTTALDADLRQSMHLGQVGSAYAWVGKALEAVTKLVSFSSWYRMIEMLTPI